MRKVLSVLILIFLPALIKAQTLAVMYTDTLICLGSNTIKLPYAISGTYSSGNVFTAQLSDASGSFSSQVNIGTLTSTISDTILCTIPTNTTPGNGYKIRIVSSNPVNTSATNGRNIYIDPSPEFTVDTVFTACSGRPIELTVTSIDTAITYSWTGPFGYTSTVKSPHLDSPSIMSDGTYTIVASKGRCSTTKSTWLQVRYHPAAPWISSNAPICLGDTLKTWVISILTDQNSALVGPNFTDYSGGYHVFVPTLADTGIYMGYTWGTSTSDFCFSDTTYYRIEINPVFVPTVIIWPTPRNSVGPYTPVTLHSQVINGLKPKYQWYLNGNAIAGATDSMYIVQNFVSGDRFHLMVSSDTTCTRTVSSDTVTLNINLVVEDWPTKDKLSIYPNPTTGNFSIGPGMTAAGRATLEVFNTIGQCILRENVQVNNGSIKDIDISSTPAGIYHIRLTTEKEQFRASFRKE